jgi:hypothetical protein
VSVLLMTILYDEGGRPITGVSRDGEHV